MNMNNWLSSKNLWRGTAVLYFIAYFPTFFIYAALFIINPVDTPINVKPSPRPIGELMLVVMYCTSVLVSLIAISYATFSKREHTTWIKLCLGILAVIPLLFLTALAVFSNFYLILQPFWYLIEFQ